MNKTFHPRTPAAALLLGLSFAAPLHAVPVYIALGDSITFGETDLAYIPSYGDRGYVSLYADALASANGGQRPLVFNLAIDGETASSFKTGSGRTVPVVGRTDVPLALQNLNYNTQLQPQGNLFANTVAAQTAGGNTVQAVTITLGFNEIAALSALPPQQALDAIAPTLADYRTQYGAVLDQVRALLPDTRLTLLGYYNPFPADPASPAAPIFDAAGPQLNAVIGELAADYGAFFVNTAPAFVGREAELTFQDEQPAGTTIAGRFGGLLPIGNVHANDLGYAAIGAQVIAVPEPSTWALMAAGLVMLGAVRGRPRHRARPSSPQSA